VPCQCGRAFEPQEVIGGIAPGRYADIIIVPSEEMIKPEIVISNGLIVHQNIEDKIEPHHHHYPASMRNRVSLKEDLEASVFYVKSPSDSSNTKVRVIDQITLYSLKNEPLI
jgi:adenine deaminase